MRIVLSLVVAACAIAQEDPLALLSRVQTNVKTTLERLPRYMCTETVDRLTFEPDGRTRTNNACDQAAAAIRSRPDKSDRLRVDVTIGQGTEMYSWVGEQRFDDRDLTDMVKDGAISTGNFATILTAVFGTTDASFTYNGDVTVDGRELSEFGFVVPVDKSRLTFGKALNAFVTGYSGTFRVDPKTAELVHLEETTERLPAQTLACYGSTTLDYVRVQIKGYNFLLPKASILRITRADGGVAENRMAFSNCHEFHAESKLSFDEAAETVASPARKTQPLVIPAGIRFTVALTDGIDTASAAAGDPVKSQLTTSIKVGDVTLEAGTRIAARIMRIVDNRGTASVTLHVKLERIEVNGAWTDLQALPHTSEAFDRKKDQRNLNRRIALGFFSGVEERAAQFVFRDVKQPYLIQSGLESSWIAIE